MTPQEKLLARVFFKLKVHEADGFAYEHLFAQVMQYAEPSFVKIRPYGNQGDRGNDGYVPQAGRYYQMYAPQDSTNKSEFAAIKKAKADFVNKLLPYWGTFCPCKEYIFVLNDKYRGSTLPLDQTLSDIRKENTLDIAKVLLAKDLEDIVMALPEDQLMMIVGYIPNESSVQAMDYGVLGEVIAHILNMPHNPARIGKLVVPDIDEKIQFNGLHVNAHWLKAKQYETYQIDDYLRLNSDFAKDSLREKLANCYAEVLHHFDFDAGIPENELGDVIFCAIMEKIVPPSGSLNERSRRDVALVIMAKYFETCDIFEEPPHVAS